MKVLVTGGTGFTGKALVRRLLDEGHEVIALDYKEGLKTNEIREWGAKVILGSVTDRAIVDQAMDGVEIVHHLAAAFRELNVDNSFYEEVNIEGTRNVLASAMAHGVRKVIYCSTCGVHGNIDNPPGNEDAPIKPADYYQRTKYEAEPIVAEYQAKGLETVILRPAAIYGPGDPERFLMIFKHVAKGSFPMFGTGKTLYHPLYIDNLVEAFLLCMPQGVGAGRAYLIADEHYYPIDEIVRKVGNALDVPVKLRYLPILPVVIAGHVCETVCKPFKISPPIFPRRVDWYRQNRAFDVSRAKSEIGYLPSVDLDEGLRRTAVWCKENGLLPS